jgi:plastocyanin
VGEPNGKTNQITIDNFSYSPAELKVAPGTTVTWTNHDDVPHTVTENNFKFKSPALDTDEAFSYKFETPGTYEYFCSLHPRMVARVIVSK